MTGSPYPLKDDASTEHFKLTYYAPPKGLEREILTLFDLEWDEDAIHDRHVGALGQLFLTRCGEGVIQFKDNTDILGGPASLFSGFDRAAPFSLKGPWHSHGASLSALGWASLVQHPADAYRNRVVPAQQLLGDEVMHLSNRHAEQIHAGTMTGEQACFDLAEWIRARLVPLPPTHEMVIEKTMAWLGSALNPPVETLLEAQNYSRKQVERLVLRYFGLTPSRLARKYRAIRTANLLSGDRLSDGDEAEIAAAFTDQPHMIREIRRYCGYTPKRLGGEGEPMFQQLLRMKNLEHHPAYRRANSANDSQ